MHGATRLLAELNSSGSDLVAARALHAGGRGGEEGWREREFWHP